MQFDELMEEFDLTEAETFDRRLICDMRPHGVLEAYHLSKNRIILSLINANERGRGERVCSVVFNKGDANEAILSAVDGNEKMSGEQILKDLGVQNLQDPRKIIDALIDLFPKRTTAAPRACN